MGIWDGAHLLPSHTKTGQAVKFLSHSHPLLESMPHSLQRVCVSSRHICWPLRPVLAITWMKPRHLLPRIYLQGYKSPSYWTTSTSTSSHVPPHTHTQLLALINPTRNCSYDMTMYEMKWNCWEKRPIYYVLHATAVHHAFSLKLA